MAELLARLNSEMASLVAQGQRSLGQTRNGRHGMGAGIIWRPDGLIVTNAHVVGQPAPRVRLADGQTYAARILAHDARRALAAPHGGPGTPAARCPLPAAASSASTRWSWAPNSVPPCRCTSSRRFSSATLLGVPPRRRKPLCDAEGRAATP